MTTVCQGPIRRPGTRWHACQSIPFPTTVGILFIHTPPAFKIEKHAFHCVPYGQRHHTLNPWSTTMQPTKAQAEPRVSGQPVWTHLKKTFVP